MSVPRMPADLSTLHGALVIEAQWIHDYWRAILTLAGTQDDVDLLNAVAPHFFAQVQYAFGREIVMGVARLSDSPGSGQRANVTLRSLYQHPAVQALPHLVERCSGCLERFDAATVTIRELRNKHLAHRDTRTASRKTAGTIANDIRAGEIDAALAEIGALLNEVAIAFGRGAIAYNHLAAGGMFGAQALLNTLYDCKGR